MFAKKKKIFYFLFFDILHDSIFQKKICLTLHATFTFKKKNNKQTNLSQTDIELSSKKPNYVAKAWYYLASVRNPG